MSDDITRSDYHAGFIAALKSKYDDHYSFMATQKEVELGEDAPRTDAVVLKKEPYAVLPDVVGCFFKEHNVIEFKGYGSGISIRDFYKALGYTLFYMSIDKKVEEVPEVDNVTVTVLQYKYPREVFKTLKELGCTVTQRATGVYEVKGRLTPFAYQVVDLELVGKGWEILKILVPGASEADIRTVCDEYAKTPDGPEREHYETVLRISMENNKKTYEKIDKEESKLNSAAKEIFADLFEETAKNATQQNRMETAKRMLIKKYPVEEIADLTQLTLDDIVSIAIDLPKEALAS